jgi:lipoprotein-releasing system permease protein
MFTPYPFFIGLRYIRSKRRNRFISFVSFVSLAGMVLGVMALIIVLSVMNGFEGEVRQRLLTLIPHVLVSTTEKPMADWQQQADVIRQHQQVLAAAPYIGGNVMLSRPGVVRGVQVNGLLPEEEARVSALEKHLIAGNLQDLRGGEFNMIVGGLLARQMGLGIGDKVSLVLPEVTVTPAGIFPRMKRFTVVGIFQVGAQVDSNLALIHLDDAARLYRTGNSVHGLRLKLKNLYRARQVAAELEMDAGDSLQVRDWSQTQGSLFQAIKMEKTMVTLLLLIVIAVAAFNIVSILVMMVADKRADIAVLRTLGASPGQIQKIFIVQGVCIGLAGMLVGALLGCVLAPDIGSIIAVFETALGLQIFDPNVYFISHIPSDVQLPDIVTICFSSLLLSLLATLYPAYRAAKVEPAEVLRYE